MFCSDSWDNQWKDFNCGQKQWRVCGPVGRTGGIFRVLCPFGSEVELFN